MNPRIPRSFVLALCAVLIAGLAVAPPRQARAQEYEHGHERHEGGGGFGTGAAIGIGIGVGRMIGEQMRRRQIEENIERSITRQQRNRRRKEKREAERTHVDVARVQECLQTAGFEPGPADGAPGPKTMRAFRRFQEANGLGNRSDDLADKPSTERLFSICEGPPDYGLVKAASEVERSVTAGQQTGRPVEGATVTSLAPVRTDRQ